jgi:tellurite resistance protein TerC
MIEITPWHWAGFIICILFFIALDLGTFSRGPKVLSFTQALLWSGLWVGLALLFAVGMNHWRGPAAATQFVTGYLIELSLSLDNILVIALIFSAFKVPEPLQHPVLVWGILGALTMRGVMIGVGAELIHQFAWILYVFGAFLVFTGIKMAFTRQAAVDPDNHPLVRLVRKFFPVAPDFVGTRFLTVINGRRALTPLAVVLLLVESSDLIFAVDSVPAVFSVTRDAFIVFTSNVFAILGLRSLYFLLAGAMAYFRYLKFGLSVVLVFVGLKMLVEPHHGEPLWFQIGISNGQSLAIIGAILGLAMTFSVAAARRENRRRA